MSDIDFDELDREVSKLVGSNAASTTSNDSSTTAPLVSAQEDSSEHSVAVSVNTVTPADANETATALPTTAQSRGRFMDMVHPSSDMAKEGDAASQLSSSSARQVLKPILAQEIEASDQGETPDGGMSVDTSEAEEGASQAEPSIAPSTDMPDPLDVHEKLSHEESSRAEAAPEPSSASSSLTALAGGSDEQAVSPFVADAKEEKRPLGQFSDTSEPAKSESDAAIEKILSQDTDDGVSQETQQADKDEAVQYNLPPELEKDLVAIEAGESPDDILSGDYDKKPDEDKESKEAPRTSEEKKETDLSTDKKLEDTSAALLASGSIPQQYKLAIKEKAGIKDEDTSLFQAEHYEIPPHKKSHHKSKAASILQWVFIIVGILLLGSTLGFAVFTFVSGQ